MSQTKQSIAIIGARDNIGSQMAKIFSAGNYRILLFDTHVSDVHEVEKSLLKNNPNADIEVIECKHEACWEADLIILSIPFNILEEIAEKIRDVSTQKIVIYLQQNSDVSSCDVSEELENLLPLSKIVSVRLHPNVSEEIKKNTEYKIELSGKNSMAEDEVQKLFEDAGFELLVPTGLQKSNH